MTHWQLVLSLSIGTQFSNSSNKVNVYPSYMIDYSQPPQNYVMGLSSIDEDYGMSCYSSST